MSLRRRTRNASTRTLLRLAWILEYGGDVGHLVLGPFLTPGSNSPRRRRDQPTCLNVPERAPAAASCTTQATFIMFSPSKIAARESIAKEVAAQLQQLGVPIHGRTFLDVSFSLDLNAALMRTLGTTVFGVMS